VLACLRISPDFVCSMGPGPAMASIPQVSKALIL
jgi:hypothetical protein